MTVDTKAEFKNVQMQLKGKKEIASFKKEFKRSGFRSQAEFMRAVYFFYVKATSEA